MIQRRPLYQIGDPYGLSFVYFCMSLCLVLGVIPESSRMYACMILSPASCHAIDQDNAGGGGGGGFQPSKIGWNPTIKTIKKNSGNITSHRKMGCL